MASLGRIEEFSGDNNNSWEEYAERLECFFDANDIDGEEKKRSILLSVCGATTYSTLRALVAPDKPKDVSYVDLVKTLSEHFNPKPSEIVQRFYFHNCKQKPGQSITVFIAVLYIFRIYCGFTYAKL